MSFFSNPANVGDSAAVGATGLIFPAYGANQGALRNKNTAAGLNASSASGFWTTLTTSHTAKLYETAVLTAAADTSEQTVVSVTGEGVLTHVIAPVLSASGTMTIKITTDNTVNTLTGPTHDNVSRLIMGHFRKILPQTAATNDVGIGSGTDDGYDTIAQTDFYMTTPADAMNDGIGIVFKNRLKVTIQGSVNITGTAESNKAGVGYLSYIPVGL